MDTLRPKVTVKLAHSSSPASSRPSSPARIVTTNTTTATTTNTSSPPLFRPKAKVTSSATLRVGAGKASSTVGSSSASEASSRPNSPLRRAATPRTPSSHVSSSTVTRARSTVGLGVRAPSSSASVSPLPSPSTPLTPEMRSRALTASDAPPSATDRLVLDSRRSRTPSMSLNHSASVSNFRVVSSELGASGSSGLGTGPTTSSPLAGGGGHRRLSASKSVLGLSDEAGLSSNSNLGGIRVRAKVSGLAKASPNATTPIAENGNGLGIGLGPPPGAVTSARAVSMQSRQRTPSISSAVSGASGSASGSATGSGSASTVGLASPPITSPSSPPSASSSVTSPTPSAPFVFYPITTAVPAANPHRYASPRPPPIRSQPNGTVTSNGAGIYASPKGAFTSSPSNPSPLSSPSPLGVERIRSVGGNVITVGMTAKVDPANVPLPPNSPPVSNLSFSSRSSASVGGGPRDVDERDGDDSTIALGVGVKEVMDLNSPEAIAKKARAEAKSNRKIEDLEISNRSLLVINASLEATKNKQAKEIRDLRRKLRESRLLLPPPTFRSLQASSSGVASGLGGVGGVENGDRDVVRPEAVDARLNTLFDEEDEEISDGEGEEMIQGAGDETYKRIRSIIDGLLKTGQEALEARIEIPAVVYEPETIRHEGEREEEEEEEKKQPTTRVLSAEEVKDWNWRRGLGVNGGPGSVISAVTNLSRSPSPSVGRRSLGADTIVGFGDVRSGLDVIGKDEDGQGGDVDDISIDVDDLGNSDDDHDDEDDDGDVSFESGMGEVIRGRAAGDSSDDGDDFILHSDSAGLFNGRRRGSSSGLSMGVGRTPGILVTQPT